MRALRVVGVTGDGSVVLEDPGRRERYTVPADEQLRAAARGDVTRLGQIAIELESQLRPREIQARIRGGASVDEVAAAAGVPTQKIERFAYPVLLERSRTAELAQGAHPQRTDGPDSRTLGETVAHTFGLRGQDFTSAGWDSWKGEDGKWVVVLTWQTGRSDNAAHWAFQPGAHGGTVVPLDEHASDLVEGLPARPLRPLGAVVDMAREDEQAPSPSAPASAEPARAVAGGQAHPPAESWAGRGIAPEQRRSSPPPRTRVEPSARASATRTDETRPPAADAPMIAREDRAADDTVAAAPAGGSEPAGERPGTATSQGTGTPPATGTATQDSATQDSGVGTGDAGTGTGATAPDGRATASTDTAPATDASTADDAAGTAETGAGAAPRLDAAPDASAPTRAEDPATPRSRTTEDAGTGGTATAAPAGSAAEEGPADESPEREAGEPEPASRQRGGAAARRTKKGKPVMPSWDEVLLGVRGQR